MTTNVQTLIDRIERVTKAAAAIDQTGLDWFTIALTEVTPAEMLAIAEHYGSEVKESTSRFETHVDANGHRVWIRTAYGTSKLTTPANSIERLRELVGAELPLGIATEDNPNFSKN